MEELLLSRRQLYYREHRAEKIAYAKRYQKEHQEKALGYGRKYYRRNKEVLDRAATARRQKRVKERKQFIFDWFKSHPRAYQVHRLERVLKKVILKRKSQARERKHTRLYRARKLKTLCNLSAVQEQEILASGCFFCKVKLDLTIAHDIPTSKGGNTTRGNCFCLCRSCNSRMSNRNLSEVLTQLPLEI